MVGWATEWLRRRRRPLDLEERNRWIAWRAGPAPVGDGGVEGEAAEVMFGCGHRVKVIVTKGRPFDVPAPCPDCAAVPPPPETPAYGDVTADGFKYGCWDCEDAIQHPSHLLEAPPETPEPARCWMCGGHQWIDKRETGENPWWSDATGGESGQRWPVYSLHAAPGVHRGELIECPFCNPKPAVSEIRRLSEELTQAREHAELAWAEASSYVADTIAERDAARAEADRLRIDLACATDGPTTDEWMAMVSAARAEAEEMRAARDYLLSVVEQLHVDSHDALDAARQSPQEGTEDEEREPYCGVCDAEGHSPSDCMPFEEEA